MIRQVSVCLNRGKMLSWENCCNDIFFTPSILMVVAHHPEMPWNLALWSFASMFDTLASRCPPLPPSPYLDQKHLSEFSSVLKRGLVGGTVVRTLTLSINHSIYIGPIDIVPVVRGVWREDSRPGIWDYRRSGSHSIARERKFAVERE